MNTILNFSSNIFFSILGLIICIKFSNANVVNKDHSDFLSAISSLSTTMVDKTLMIQAPSITGGNESSLGKTSSHFTYKKKKVKPPEVHKSGNLSLQLKPKYEISEKKTFDNGGKSKSYSIQKCLLSKNSDLIERISNFSIKLSKGIGAKNKHLENENIKLKKENIFLKKELDYKPSYKNNLGKSDLLVPSNAEAYSSGYAAAEKIKKMLNEQKNLGISLPNEIFFSGFYDGFSGRSLIPVYQIKKMYSLHLNNLHNKEKSEFQRGLQEIAVRTKNLDVVKRNQSLFFCKHTQGSGIWKNGDKGWFDVNLVTLSGTKLEERKNIPFVYTDKLPYIFSQAIMLSGKNGVIDVYGFASDIYSNNGLPSGVLPYTVVRLTISNKYIHN